MMIFFYAFRNCLRNPRRAFLLICTIAVGTMGLFLFHGFNNGLLAQYRVNTIQAKYGHGQIFRKGFYGKVLEEPWKLWIEDVEATKSQLSSLPQVKHVFPRLSFAGILNHGQKSVNGIGTGIDGAEERKFFDKLNVIEGEALSGNTHKIVLGVGLAKALNAKVGDKITVLVNTLAGSMNSVTLELGGIFQIGARDIDDRFFQIEFSAAQTLLDTKAAESIAIALNKDGDWPAIETFANQSTLGIEAVPFETLDWIYYGNSVKWLGKQFGVFQYIILMIVLLGVFTTVSISILERREEFGFLRSNGETRTYISAVLLAESLLYAFGGASLGIGLAYLINSTALANGLIMPPAPGFTLPFRFHILLNMPQGLAVSVQCILTTFVATAFAGFRALRISIAESIRAV